jgi:hypothetical protein
MLQCGFQLSSGTTCLRQLGGLSSQRRPSNGPRPTPAGRTPPSTRSPARTSTRSASPPRTRGRFRDGFEVAPSQPLRDHCLSCRRYEGCSSGTGLRGWGRDPTNPESEPRMNIHENARMTVHGRALLVTRICEEGWRVEDAARAAGRFRAHRLHVAGPLPHGWAGGLERTASRRPAAARMPPRPSRSPRSSGCGGRG